MSRDETKSLPCGHDERFNVTWRELRSGYANVFVQFCVACNFESINKRIAERESGKGVREDAD